MASITNDPNGRRRLQFTDANGRRQTIRLGKMPKRTAESVKVYVEHLVNAKVTKHPIDGETARWVASLDDVLAGKLAKARLIQARDSATLDAFLESYIESRKAEAAASTITNFQHVRRSLVEYFGTDRDLREISEGDADDWRQSLVDRYAIATISKLVKRARQVFRYAVRKGLANMNPFQELKAGSEQNDSRKHFVEREPIAKVLDACPNVQWRLIVALARYGVVRTPSETLRLRWGDIDWERQRFTVTSPKTKNKANRGALYRCSQNC